MLLFLMPSGKLSLIDVRASVGVTVLTATTLTCVMSRGLPAGCVLK
jgi:hypothetical protein